MRERAPSPHDFISAALTESALSRDDAALTHSHKGSFHAGDNKAPFSPPSLQQGKFSGPSGNDPLIFT